jgi:uncharacterized membrane protein
MEPSVNVIVLWLLFAGTHIGLAASRPRRVLVRRFGEWGFMGIFSAVAIVAFSALIHYFAEHRFEGTVSPILATAPIVRRLLFVTAAFGAALVGLGLFDYPESAYGLAARRKAYDVRPVERISRHSFFAGLGLVGAAHVLLVTHLVGAVFFACLGLFTWLGSMHQDAKLLAQRGEVHRRYLAATSTFPFAAILAGRRRFDLTGMPPMAVAGAVLIPVLLRMLHDSLFAAGGAYLIAVTIAGAAVATLQSWRAQRRALERTPTGHAGISSSGA